MPVSGEKWSLFQPFYDVEKSKLGPSLFASPEEFLSTFGKRVEWLDKIYPSEAEQLSIHRAQKMYFEMLKSSVTATVFNGAEKQVVPGLKQIPLMPFHLESRKAGGDWTYLGDTMTGWKRIDNVWELLKNVVNEDIPGDYIETGVWRGGSSVFARGVLNAFGEKDRQSYVCDSFAGLPPGDRDLHKRDKDWDLMHWYLAVPDEIVAQNFQKYGLLDHNVIFAKGFFNETMPQIKKYHPPTRKFSVMRLDGDMYESTVDVLYNLYDKLSIGGYVIMDDWFGFPSKVACEDFFQVHGINPEIIPIDNLSAYWKKTEEVDIQFWRYEQNKFKNNTSLRK
mmetsp:Transcript_15835/g.36322  ORF Transcript_15835/g.36322 Transcript_15835/m.36322 type:complete len:336 (+) Transcript_15835:205-1212(+)